MLAINNESRQCRTCRETKPLQQGYHKAKNGKQGYNAHCKECISEKQTKRLSTPEGRAQYNVYAKRHREKPGYQEKHNRYRNCPNGKWRGYRKDAARHGRVFEFTLEEFTERFWQKQCYYCGVAHPTAGIDRLDNSLGYSGANSVPCCGICNLMKRTSTANDFIEKCRAITKHQEGTPAPHRLASKN